MNKTRPLSRIIFFSVIAQIINLLGIFLISDTLHIPLFMDTIGTVFIVFYAGLIPGLIVGLSYNMFRVFFIMFFYGNPFYPWESLYSLCGAAIAFFTWFLYWKKRNFYLTRSIAFFYLILISLVTAFASSVIGGTIEVLRRFFFDDQAYINPVNNFVVSFLGQHFGLWISCIFSRIPISLLDRLISTFLGAAIYQLVRLRERSQESHKQI